MPEHIAQCQLVLDFFEPTPYDLRPRKEKKSDEQIVGDSISDPLPLETFYPIADYMKTGKGEVSLRTGSPVDVIEKTETGFDLFNGVFVPSCALVSVSNFAHVFCFFRMVVC